MYHKKALIHIIYIDVPYVHEKKLKKINMYIMLHKSTLMYIMVEKKLKNVHLWAKNLFNGT